jgi:hypothetical protein
VGLTAGPVRTALYAAWRVACGDELASVFYDLTHPVGNELRNPRPPRPAGVATQSSLDAELEALDPLRKDPLIQLARAL